MSNLIGKRVQINITLGQDVNGPAFEIAATEIDAQSTRQINPHQAMIMVQSMLIQYTQILQKNLPREPEPQILVPSGPVPNLRHN